MKGGSRQQQYSDYHSLSFTFHINATFTRDKSWNIMI